MEFKKLSIEQLMPATYNPRKDLKPGDAEFEKIRKSIDEFGYVEPIIVNKDLTIIGGHQRCKVLKQLGVKEIECIIVDVDKTKEKALNIALNKISGEWDMNSLASLLNDLNNEAYNIELTGFDFAEAEKLWDEYIKDSEKSSQEEELPEVPEEAVIEIGDLILLNKHRILCGDALSNSDIIRLMDDEKAKLIVTDPPYGVSYVGKTEKAMTIQNDNLQDDDFYKFLLSAFKNVYQISDDGASIYVFHADSKGLIFRQAFLNAGFKHSQCCIWVKNTFVMGRQPYQWQHEPALFGWKPTGSHYWNSDRKQSTIWHFDKPKANDIHPTMKPLPLLEYIIKNSSKYGDLVVDTFLGSGSTLVAADNTNRICYGIELEPKYCQVIIERYINYKDNFKGEDVKIIRDNKELTFKQLIEKKVC